MLISEEYSGIYVKVQLFYLLFLVEISNALEKVSFTEMSLKYNGG